MVNNWYKNKFIEERTRDWLLVKDGVSPKIYGLIKTHKPEMPMRPIVSCIDSPYYKMSKYFGNIVSQIIGRNRYHVKDSFHFHDAVKHQTVPEGFGFASFDIISMYTNIPIDLALEVVEKNWNKLSKLTKLPKKEFMYGIEICLKSTFFKYNDEFYEQIEGLAMGAPLSACIANLVAEYVQGKVLPKCKREVSFFKRFFDDCFLIVRLSKVNEILNLFNSFHPSLKFTCELEEDNSINFMDLTIEHKRGIKINTKWFQKTTHSGRYLHFLSEVPFHQKTNVAKNLFQRVIRLTDKCFQEECIVKAKKLLVENGYPVKLVDNLSKKFRHIQIRPQKLAKNFDTSKIVKMPYVPKLSEKLKNSLKTVGMEAVFANRFNNKKLFTRLKSTEPVGNVSNVVYEINCENCNGSYIGQTKRFLKERIKSHTYDKNEKTALKKHMQETGHTFNFKNTKILAREKNSTARLFLEAIHIKKGLEPLNSKTDTQCLSVVYDPILISSHGDG